MILAHNATLNVYYLIPFFSRKNGYHIITLSCLMLGPFKYTFATSSYHH